MRKGCLFLFFLFLASAVQAQFSGGDGSADNPYLIANRADLNKIRDYIGPDNANLYFRQTADIDLSESNWTPIGSSGSDLTKQFRGKYHGGGYKILNLKTTAQYGGLFGVVNAGAIVEDVHVVSGNLDYTPSGSSGYVAAIVGHIRLSEDGDVIIRNNSNSATINTHGNASSAAAGIVAYVYASANGSVTIEQNENTGIITGNGTRTGGIAGYVYAYNSGATPTITFNISSNYNGGDVTSVLQTATSTTQVRVGGIIGLLYIPQANVTTTIANNFSYAKLETTIPDGQSYIGGIAGHLQASSASTEATITFEKNFAGGSIVGVTTNSELRTGGLIGYISRSVSDVYVRYSVSAQTIINRYSSSGHRIYGSSSSGDGSFTQSSNYAYKDTKLINATETKTASDNSSNEGTGKTLEELLSQATYSALSWDFTDTWQIAEGTTYPYLKWQAGRNGISDSYLPAIEYTYSGNTTPITFTLDNAASPVIAVPVNIDEVNFTVTPPTGGTVAIEQNPLSLLPASITPNKVFSVSESNIHAIYFFQVHNFPSYTVTFDYQDGTTPSGSATANYDNSYKITAPIPPVTDNYTTITGWYTEEEYINRWDFDTPVTQDTTLFARWGAYYEGDGDASNPYIIHNQIQLDGIREHLASHFKLANDIALTFSVDGNGWTPIADFSGDPDNADAFTGTLDGDGHQITGLWSKFASAGQGLIAKSAGNIYNLGIAIAEKGIVSSAATNYAGGLAGYVTGGNINRVYVIGEKDAQITGAAIATGGLVGTVNGTANIDNSYAAIDLNSVITSATATGGLVGNSTGNITNCYASGNVTGTGGQTGGLIGSVASGAITNCFAVGKVTGPDNNTGAFAGLGGATITGCGYNSEVNDGLPAIGSGEGSPTALTSVQLKQAATYAAWNIASSADWGIYDGYGYPYIKAIGNEVLITPSGGLTATYTGDPVTVSFAWTASENYDTSVSEITGAPALDAEQPLVNAGTYTFTSGTLDLQNPHYQLSFKNDVRIVITPAEQSITFTPATTLDMRESLTYSLSATATSGLPVLFRLREADAGYAELSGNVLTLKASKTIEVTAYVAHNDNYIDATEVTVSITIIDTGTAIRNLSNALTAKVTNGVLKVSGIALGASVGVYNVQGITIHQATTLAGEQNIPLPARGVYVVVVGEKKIKVIY
jgi:hypothetical protein